MNNRIALAAFYIITGSIIASMSLAAMALYVFVETKAATSIYSDEGMQWCWRVLCGLVAGAIFVLIIAKKSDTALDHAKKGLALLPLVLFSVAATMTSNLGMLSDNDKGKINNMQIIKSKQIELDRLYEQQKVLIEGKTISFNAAPQIRQDISALNDEIEQLQASQQSTVNEKYSALNIDMGLFKVNALDVFMFLGASLGIIALFIEFVLAWVAAPMFAKASALISQGFAQGSQDYSHGDSREDDEKFAQDKKSSQDIRDEKKILKSVDKFNKISSDDRRHKINTLVGLMLVDKKVTSKVNCRKYSDPEKFPTRLCEEAFDIVKLKRAEIERQELEKGQLNGY